MVQKGATLLPSTAAAPLRHTRPTPSASCQAQSSSWHAAPQSPWILGCACRSWCTAPATPVGGAPLLQISASPAQQKGSRWRHLLSYKSHAYTMHTRSAVACLPPSPPCLRRSVILPAPHCSIGPGSTCCSSANGLGGGPRGLATAPDDPPAAAADVRAALPVSGCQRPLEAPGEPDCAEPAFASTSANGLRLRLLLRRSRDAGPTAPLSACAAITALPLAGCSAPALAGGASMRTSGGSS